MTPQMGAIEETIGTNTPMISPPIKEAKDGVI